MVAISVLGLVVALLLSVATWNMWWGGWNWGLRLYVPALPLLAVAAGFGLQSLPRGFRIIAGPVVLIAGVVWAVPCVLTDLFGGYAGVYDGTAGAFRIDAYPAIGAWQFIEHWRALTPTDSAAADILWLRTARSTGNASLLPMLILFSVSGALFARVLHAIRAVPQQQTCSDLANPSSLVEP